MSLRDWRRKISAPVASRLACAMLCVGLLSCTPAIFQRAPAEGIPTRVWQPGELITNLSQRLEQLRSMRALANVHYSGPQGRGGFQEAILVQRPDRLRLETLSMLGVILIVTVDDKEIAGYDPREGVFLRGPRSKENLLRLTQIPLELDEVTKLLMGLPPVDIRGAWEQQESSLMFSLKGGGKDVVVFTSQHPVPTKWQRFSARGVIEMSAELTDYVETPAGLFPSKVIFEAPAQKKRLEIRFQEPELNVALSPALFSQEKPANVKELPIEALGG